MRALPTVSLRPIAFAALCMASSAGPALAGGFAAPEISVRGMGRANSGEAAQVGVDSVWWNPAAIARSGREVSVGVHWRDPSTPITDAGSTITRPIPPAGLTTPVGGLSTVKDGYQKFIAPNLAVALPVGDRFAVGLSLVRPFRLKGDFGANAWSRYDTVRNRIDVADMQLTSAFQATDWLDLGVGVDAQYMKAALDSAYPNLSPLDPDGLSALKGDGWDYGWTVGAQAHSESLTVGVSYRAAIDHTINGDITLTGLTGLLAGANFTAPAETRFTTPWTLTLAGRWAATPALTLQAQVVRAGWSKYDDIDVAFAGTGVAIPQGYKNTTSVALGADYQLAPSWTVRGGVRIEPTPTPDALREPGVADADRVVYAVGASHEMGSATLHGALSYTDYDKAPLNDANDFYQGTPAAISAPLKGRFSGHALTGSIGLGWRF